MKISEATESFLGYLQSRKKRAASTITTYRSILGQFTDIIGDKDLSDLTLQDIDSYAEKLTVLGFADKTYRNKITPIRSFVKYLYIKDMTAIKPEQVDVPPDPESEANFLTDEEAERFIEACADTRDKALMLMLLTSAMRVSECVKARYEDSYNRSILVRRGKGGGARPVKITEEALHFYEKYVKEKRGTEPGPLLPNPNGTPLSRQIVWRKVVAYGKKAGIAKKVTPHTLRHTWCTGFLFRGGRIEVAQKIMGHKNIQTTLIYTHFTDPYLGEQYDKNMKSKKYAKQLVA